ncbi:MULTISPECIES: taurine ABC transporter substrate-binding protein [unclassified Pseudomonas]|uniref:taurine ABC transporter substrate-binding protein n=1 Tax=unclassified Pseudomonas TaxID=196821 RepID=UPI0015A1C75A|nr:MULTISPECIES: taurine ABC transporter substrate-binding protein [unclassified Pseudomonas]NWB60460.1 taurine ABC transporter substrate-binding protein [Pseudomonas sp. F1002]NWC03069.1 taurine ABC transporter substrate-binding protein [Pseudomonas sp. G1002]
MNTLKLARNLLSAAGLAVLSLSAQSADLTIGYINGIDPIKRAIADGEYEKGIGQKIDWRRFDAGPAVLAAMASGDVQIGNLGSSPLAAAASRNMPLVAFIVSAQIRSSEALVVRDGSGIKTPDDLIGKTIAVPFVSTSHYSLLGALKHWNLDPRKVNIVNLTPAQITAAWARGDIDGAFTWSPALGEIRKTGKILTDAAEVSNWGAPTFEVWVARKDFAEKNPKVVADFARVSLAAIADYAAHKKDWTADSAPVKSIARLTGANAADIPELLEGSSFPTAAEQKSAQYLAGGTAREIGKTAEFLKEQGKIEKVLPDYSAFVSDKFIGE